MSDSQHTPGPWGVGPVYDWSISTDDDTEVAQTIAGTPNWRENARLIAAAPDLLAACQALLAEVERIAAAVRKAVSGE